MIAYQSITKPLFGAIGGLFGGGGASGSLFGASSINALGYHDGGVVGYGAFSRSVNPYLFANAPRLHGGLMPDEYPAILQKGEAVIPKDKVGGGDNVTNIDHHCHRYQSFDDTSAATLRRSSRPLTVTCAVAGCCAGRSKGRCNGIRTHVHRQRWIHENKSTYASTLSGKMPRRFQLVV